MKQAYAYIIRHADGFACMAVILFFYAVPERYGLGWFGCPILWLTNVPCPGCGLTRSLYKAFHCQFTESVSFHVLGPFLAAMFFFWSLNAFPFKSRRWKYAVIHTQTAAVSALICVWMARIILKIAGINTFL